MLCVIIHCRDLAFSLESMSKNSIQTYILMPTESMQLPISTSQNISLKGKSKVKVTDVGPYYQIRAIRSGQVILSSHHQTFFIFIYTPELYKFAKQIESLVEDMRGLRVEFSKEGPVIKGVLLHILDLLQLSELSMQHNQSFSFQAHIDEEVFKDLSSHFKQFEWTNNTPLIKLHKDKNFYYLHIAGEQKGINAYHKKYFHSFGLKTVYSQPKIDIQPMIEIQMHITELRRSGFQRLGIQWPSVYQATVLPQFAGSQLEVALSALEEAGDSHTLAKPKLLCRSGGEASFLAGGEIPIRTRGFRSRGVVWKTYGVHLNFQPVADKKGQMNIHLDTEISSIDPGQTVDGIPAFFTNKMTSDFNLKTTKTIALSGLTTYFQGHSTQGLPFLKRIPILGMLFASKDYQNKKTELLIFVTPKTVYE